MRRKCRIDNGEGKPPEEGWVIWFVSDNDGDACAVVELPDGKLTQVWAAKITMIR